MANPRFCSVNVVVPDVVAATEFLGALGIEVIGSLPEWAPHHRTFGGDTPDVDADLDSPAFARWWGGTPEGFSGVVVNFRTDSAAEVDDLHARALELGATELKAPWDAFWGSRYAVVLGPGPIAVGFMNEPDDGRRTMPPAIDDFA
ncbi:MAG: hypothetical protein AAF480_17730 [Actinomycetota bacterium]